MDETERPVEEEPEKAATEAVGQTPREETSPEAETPKKASAAAGEETDGGVSPPLTPVGRSLRETRPSVAADAEVSGGRPPVPSLSRGEREGEAPPEEPPKPVRRRVSLGERLREPDEVPIEVPPPKIRARTRRDFLLFGAGALAAAGGLWWLLPDEARQMHLTPRLRDWLDSAQARLGATSQRRERFLNRALTFDDDVAEALYSKDRLVRTYSKAQVTPLRNNYEGMTPKPDYIPSWTLSLSGLASGRADRLTIADLLTRFARREQVTRLCCVEGWSMIAWWGGLRFSDLLEAYPPDPGARWARLDSAVNLDGSGNPDPYYVSIDLATARHPQTLLATHVSGRPLPVEHGAPLRLLAPMKLGLKNIKAVTSIAYSPEEPADYWNERGYSRYDGL